MIKIDFEKQLITHICSDNKYACGKEQTLTFDEFKKNKYSVTCTPCDKENHDSNICTHCSISESYNLKAFINNLELHEHIEPEEFLFQFNQIEDEEQMHNAVDMFLSQFHPSYREEILKEGIKPKHRQANPAIWELNRQYHILRRILEHGEEYEEVKDEPDLYEEVHKKIGSGKFSKAYKEHEQGIQHIKSYLK